MYIYVASHSMLKILHHITKHQTQWSLYELHTSLFSIIVTTCRSDYYIPVGTCHFLIQPVFLSKVNAQDISTSLFSCHPSEE